MITVAAPRSCAKELVMRRQWPSARVTGGHHNRGQKASRQAGIRAWIGRLGLVGFLFFFVKGLLWLLIPSLIAMGVFE